MPAAATLDARPPAPDPTAGSGRLGADRTDRVRDEAPRHQRRAADSAAAARPEPSLRILETRILRGANYWAREPVIRQVVDLGVLEEFPSNTIPGFVDALVEMLPTLEDHACSLGRRGGFITRLREGTWLGHVAEHIALEFQNLAGTDVRHGKTRGTGEYGRYNVIFEYREEQVGIEAGKKAVALVNHLVAPNDPAFAFDLVPELEELIRLAERLAFGPSHPGADRRGRRPRHPVHPPRPVLPRPARARASTSSASGPR